MSIAARSVLRRILAEPVVGPGAPVSVLRAAEEGGPVFEAHRVEGEGARAFATALHFWAARLSAFLEGRARPDLYDALAGHCLCDPVAPERLTALLAAGGAPDWATRATIPSGLRTAWRMIEQPVFHSWVLEHRAGMTAWFATTDAWLECAEPLPPEP